MTMSTKNRLLSVGALSIAALGASWTVGAFESTYYKSGVTAGIHGGASYMWGRVKGSFDPNDGLGVRRAAGSANETDGFFGGLLGYRHFLNSGVSLGGDIVVNYHGHNNMSKRLNNGNSPFNIIVSRRQYNLTPSFVLGYVFKEKFHASLGLGLGVDRFEQQVNNIAGNVTVKGSKTQLGFVPSVGLEYAINPKWAVMGNVAYEYYGRVKRSFGQEVAPLLPGSSYNITVNPNSISGRLGVMYKF